MYIDLHECVDPVPSWTISDHTLPFTPFPLTSLSSLQGRQVRHGTRPEGSGGAVQDGHPEAAD